MNEIYFRRIGHEKELREKSQWGWKLMKNLRKKKISPFSLNIFMEKVFQTQLFLHVSMDDDDDDDEDDGCGGINLVTLISLGLYNEGNSSSSYLSLFAICHYFHFRKNFFILSLVRSNEKNSMEKNYSENFLYFLISWKCKQQKMGAVGGKT